MNLKRTAMAFFLALLHSRAFATTFAHRPIAEAIREAAVIVHGRAGESRSDHDPKGSGRILTYTRIFVDEVLKGSVPRKEILVQQPGGAKNGMELRVPGAARFEPGEEMVLLLAAPESEGSGESYGMPGLASGKYAVEHRSAGDVLISDLGPEEASETLTLADFRNLVKEQTELEAQATRSRSEPMMQRESAPPPLASTRSNAASQEDLESNPERGRWIKGLLAIVFLFALFALARNRIARTFKRR